MWNKRTTLFNCPLGISSISSFENWENDFFQFCFFQELGVRVPGRKVDRLGQLQHQQGSRHSSQVKKADTFWYVLLSFDTFRIRYVSISYTHSNLFF